MIKKHIPCVAFLLCKNDTVLLEKRKLTKRIDPGKVCIPSGDIEKNETPESALKRESEEEFGITVLEYRYVGNIIYPCDDVTFLINYFLITSWNGNIQNREADRIYWKKIHESNVDVWPDKIIIRAVREGNLLK
jgi:8-oxo-dGTP diphosphatase